MKKTLSFAGMLLLLLPTLSGCIVEGRGHDGYGRDDGYRDHPHRHCRDCY